MKYVEYIFLTRDAVLLKWIKSHLKYIALDKKPKQPVLYTNLENFEPVVHEHPEKFPGKTEFWQ
jgi:hypothetical protein